MKHIIIDAREKSRILDGFLKSSGFKARESLKIKITCHHLGMTMDEAQHREWTSCGMVIIYCLIIFVINIKMGIASDEKNLVFICHPEITESILSLNEIKDIYLGNKLFWKNNMKIHFCMMKNEEIQKQFLIKFLGKSRTQFLNYWKSMCFKGKACLKMKSLGDEKDVIEFVSRNNGAIGYISDEKLLLNNSAVKRIEIDF